MDERIQKYEEKMKKTKKMFVLLLVVMNEE